MSNSKSAPRILRRKQVSEQTGLSRSGIYEKVARGEFPRQIALGPRSVGWLETEVVEWLQSQIAKSRSGAV